jgi:hypothetical protein
MTLDFSLTSEQPGSSLVAISGSRGTIKLRN